MRLRHAQPRRGATAVETAVISSVLFLLLFALLVGGYGVFRYQEVAHLAREGARYAATHGGKYAEAGWPASTGVAAVNSADTLRPYIVNQAVNLDTSALTVAVAYAAPANANPINYPYYLDTSGNQNPPGQKTIQNYVSVTISYEWTPELWLTGPIVLKSTATTPISY
jgi:Flp pilus assembly protein TadG